MKGKRTQSLSPCIHYLVWILFVFAIFTAERERSRCWWVGSSVVECWCMAITSDTGFNSWLLRYLCFFFIIQDIDGVLWWLCLFSPIFKSYSMSFWYHMSMVCDLMNLVQVLTRSFKVYEFEFWGSITQTKLVNSHYKSLINFIQVNF